MIISHRGNLIGADPSIENNPVHIVSLTESGLDCEVDVWYCEGSWFTGHDTPYYKTSISFLKEPRLWVHCKNLAALNKLSEYSKINYFWHENDKYTITRMGHIWAYPGVDSPENGVIVHLGSDWIGKYKCSICTDYVH